MKIALFLNNGKEQYLYQRLEARGHVLNADEIPDLIVLDCDWWWARTRPEIIAQAKLEGIPVVLYPHGGLPLIFNYDGASAPDPYVSMRLEHGPGVVEIAGIIDPAFDFRQEVTGWLYSPTELFTPVENPRRVLFAPQHPNLEMIHKGLANGSDPGPALNKHVYQQLLTLGYELTVSVVGGPWRNGLWEHPKTRFVRNDMMVFEHTQELIRQADMVVAAGSTAGAAVALGKPTVMVGQFDITDFINGEYREADHASEYYDLIHYPLDTQDDPLEDLISRACAGDAGAARWRELFIGDDGTDRAIELLEGMVDNGVSTAGVTIQGVTARASLGKD